MILLRSQTAAGLSQELDIDPLELEAVQERDAPIPPDFFVDASLDELLADARAELAKQWAVMPGATASEPDVVSACARKLAG